ncbi:hypothetical protein AMK26_15755 [Streptomyces sp. CB03234]|uniref:glutamate mutase L n=1 Tax=Streptomyces sp. (strain CB03234) TaxID=1703937 RepID=UPI00093F338B|nr:glutamate mutase L [Streptomyces sp. CB03234]OKK04751.1 hypothetical protein AMK26_15755 [Streptomyces sp. CB03234]
MRKGSLTVTDSSAAPVWLLDVGSTVITLCRARPSGPADAVVRVARQPGTAPGDQAVELLARHGFDPSTDRLRACSSANGGPTVGVAGMTGRYSIAAAVRAAVFAGADIAYTRALDTPVDGPLPPVDVLVLVGGVDGTDHRRVDAAVRAVRLAEHPHRVAVWAGARDAAAVTALRPRYRVDNVLDVHLRAQCGPLSEALRRIHLDDLVDRAGLRALAELTEVPVLPTPEVVATAARRLAAEADAEGAGPFAVLDVGGTTTDVHYRAAGGGDQVESHVFTGLGVGGAHRSLLARLADAPYLGDFVHAVSPTGHRARYQRLRDGDATALPTRDAVLGCVFLALRDLHERHGVELGRAAARLVVTGGAVGGLEPALLGRVAEAACGLRSASSGCAVDEAPLLWTRGLLDPRPVGA